VEPIPQTRRVLDELTQRGDLGLADLVLAMGRNARAIVPRCVGLSLGVLEDGLTFTLVASREEISGLDAVQYLDGGPCVSGAHANQRLDFRTDDATGEHQWLLYAQATAAAGVASSLTLPIERGGRVLGTINLYASTPDAFEGHHDELARALGASAETAVSNADLSFRTRLVAAAAPERLAHQDDINRALGVISEHHRVDIPTAREHLREAAARGGITQADAARAIRDTLLP
jgi:GAF domain-containing protein